MATSLLPELSLIVDASPGVVAGLSVRQRCELQRLQLFTEQATFRAHWQELNDYVLPRRGRFYATDVNKGDRRNQRIIDTTATLASRVCAAGMMAGITSPARPWFTLSTGHPKLDQQHEVQQWLEDVTRILNAIFVKSNLYNKLPILYGDMSTFGTGAMAVMEDDDTIVRCYDFPVGTYYVANDDKLRVRTFLRVFRMTVDQIVTRWGHVDPRTGIPDFARSTVSRTVQNLWSAGNRTAWIDLVHSVQPNLSYDGRRVESRFKRYVQVYYELTAPNQPADPALLGLLEMTGFDEFPVLVGRWETNSEDVYGTNCPGMTALGDIKQLQTHEKRVMQAIEKMVNPPLMGPSQLRTSKTSLLPGDITYVDLREGMQGLRPIHEVNFNAGIAPLEQKSAQIRNRINEAFFKDLFLMLSQSDRREITAREVEERHEEKLLAVGPMLEQLNQDVLDPLIDRVFGVAARKHLLPPPPPEIAGMPLRVNYVSIMAQAQKQLGLSALERAAGFFAQVGTVKPQILDMLDEDELAIQYADMAGVPPQVLRDPKDVQAQRQQRAQATAQQQAAQNAPALAGAAKDLSQANTDGSSVLAALMNKRRAYGAIDATGAPPVAVT